MGYKLIPAKHPRYDGLLRDQEIYLPLAGAMMALRLEDDGSIVVNENPIDGQIQSWRKTCGVTHAFAIHGSCYAAINLMMLNACFRHQDVQDSGSLEFLEFVSRMMLKVHQSNNGSTE